jgi:predicted transcriptional regulator
MKSRTKEEKFLIAAYEAALLTGDADAEIDRYVVGQNIGLHPRGINVICQELTQANFIRKKGQTAIVVTDHGVNLINEIRGLPKK